jgi:hypothetical protein
VNTIQLNEQLVDIYTRCDDCKPQSTQRLVFEKGTATSSLGSKPKATSNQHALTTFQLQGDAERAVDLAASAVIEARLVGGSGIQSIKSNAILRLYLAPLTAWAIGYEECSATCINYPNNNKQCGGPILQCRTLAVVDGERPVRRNVIKLHMPSDMRDPIDNIVTHSVQITSLDVPETGFFNRRIGVQLTRGGTNEPDDRPCYITSDGFVYKVDDASARLTTGRILIHGQTGYGPEPFVNDKANTVYVRLQFGVSLWHNGDSEAASFALMLPSEDNRAYRCDVDRETTNGVDGAVTDADDLHVFKTDTNSDGYMDHAHGTLRTGDSDEGSWEGGTSCIYKFRKNQMINAGQVFYVKLKVDNPTSALKKTDVKKDAGSNNWRIKLFGKGIKAEAPRDIKNPDGYYFITKTEEQELADMTPSKTKVWYGNLGVVAPLIRPVCQPASTFRIGTPTLAVSQRMYFFFSDRL